MKYYIIENEAPAGPFEVDELIARGLRPADLVWTEGMADWAPAETIEEVRMALYGPKSNEGNYGMPAAPQSSAAGVCPPLPQQPAPSQPADYQQGYQQQGAYQQTGGYQQPYQAPMTPPNNWLVVSILVTVFCCLPFGIVGIVKAAQVNGLWEAGNYEQAYKAAADAKKWSIIGAVCSVGVYLIYIIFFLCTGILASI